MATTKPTLLPLQPTKPILNKAGSQLLSPLQTTLPSPSPHFQDSVASNKAVTSYFALPSSSSAPVTPSILLKPKLLPEAVGIAPSLLDGPPTAGLGLSGHGTPDGEAAAVEQDGGRGRGSATPGSGATTPQSTAPSSAVVSPQQDSAGTLQPSGELEVLDGGVMGTMSGRASRSPSPHCHFAPLPKVELGRPGTRRNSFALGVATRNKLISGGGEHPRPVCEHPTDGLDCRSFRFPR